MIKRDVLKSVLTASNLPYTRRKGMDETKRTSKIGSVGGQGAGGGSGANPGHGDTQMSGGVYASRYIMVNQLMARKNRGGFGAANFSGPSAAAPADAGMSGASISFPRGKCNGQSTKRSEVPPHGPDPLFLALFCPSRKFLPHSCENAAPLHLINQINKYFNKLSSVQRGVKGSATECNGSDTEGVFLALHSQVNSIRTWGHGQKVHQCNAKYPRSSQFSLFSPGSSVKALIPLDVWPGDGSGIPQFRSVGKRIKDTFYSLSSSCFTLYSSDRYIKGLSFPVMGLCKLILVTWLTSQSKLRNQEGKIGIQDVPQGTLVTAHNYKLCDKGVNEVPDSDSLRGEVSQNSAIGIELVRIPRSGSAQSSLVQFPRSGPEDPPPYQNLSDPAPTPPLLLIINCRVPQNPFFVSQNPLIVSVRTLIASVTHFILAPVVDLAGKRGSGGFFSLCPSLLGGPGGRSC
jgi:hypothetical protein